MKFEMQKAILLSENIDGFIKFVQHNHENKNSYRFNPDKLYQIKLFIDEYKFQLIADELWRINQYDWDGKYTHILLDLFIQGFNVIDEYVNNHAHDLFLLKGRLFTLKNLSLSFSSPF
jgi:hypothetical protein